MTTAEYFTRWVPILIGLGLLLNAPVYILLFLIWRK